MHAAISGTIDFREPDDDDVPRAAAPAGRRCCPRTAATSIRPTAAGPAAGGPDRRCSTATPRQEYDVRDLLAVHPRRRARSTSTRPSSARRSSAATAGSAAWPVGVVANQQQALQAGDGAAPVRRRDLRRLAPTRPPGSSWTATRRGVPLLFLQDVNGFMVGRTPSRPASSGPGRSWSTPSRNSVVPKLTLIIGGSFGAGNYALCGKAFDPRFIFAWPTARYAVMGGDQAAEHAARHPGAGARSGPARSRTRPSWRSCATR